MEIESLYLGDQESDSPFEVGRKYTAEGKALSFAGNTFVMHTRYQPDLQARLIELQHQLANLSGSHNFSFLPTDSYHITLFRGAHMHNPTPGYWPEQLPKTLSQSALEEWMIARLDGFSVGLPLKFRATELTVSKSGHLLYLEPSDDDTVLQIDRLRAELAIRLNMDATDLIAKRLHISLSYLCCWLSKEQALAHEESIKSLDEELIRQFEEFELCQLDFCRYLDMTAFEPISSWTSTMNRENNAEGSMFAIKLNT